VTRGGVRECTILAPTPPPSTTGYPLPHRRLDSTNTRREAIRYEAVAALASRAPTHAPPGASYPHPGLVPTP